MDGDGGYLLYAFLVFCFLMVCVAIAWFAAWTILLAIGVLGLIVFLGLLPFIIQGFREEWRRGRRS